MLGSILVVRIPLNGQKPFHSTAEVRTALYGSAEEEKVPSFRRTDAGNVLEVYCESALMADDKCVGMMTKVTVRTEERTDYFSRPFGWVNGYWFYWYWVPGYLRYDPRDRLSMPIADKLGLWFERALKETGEWDKYDRKIAIYPATLGKIAYNRDLSGNGPMTIMSFTLDTWTTYAHELGHDIGLPHSSAPTDATSPAGSHAMFAYADDAMMGLQSSLAEVLAKKRVGKTDFNAPARYRLGWIEAAAVLDGSVDDTGILKPLNVEATVTSPFLVLKQECAECWSKPVTGYNKNRPAMKGGALIASFRVDRDAGGDNNDFGIVGVDLVNKVHVHFLSAKGGAGTIQRWAVLAEDGEYEWRAAPDDLTSPVLGGLVVCKLVSTADSTDDDYAKIAVGTNAADARSKCATNTISSAITCSGGSWQGDVGWSLSCSDGTTLSGGAPYASPSQATEKRSLGLIPDYVTRPDPCRSGPLQVSSCALVVEVGATCTLDMTDSWGDGWTGNVWAAPGFGQSFSLANGKQGTKSFVVQPGTSG